MNWFAGGIRGDMCVAAFNLLMRKIYPSCLWWGEFRDKHDVVQELALAPSVLHLLSLILV